MNETLFKLPRVPFIQGHRYTVRATEGPINQTTNHQLEIMSEPERGNFKSVLGMLSFVYPRQLRLIPLFTSAACCHFSARLPENYSQVPRYRDMMKVASA